MLPHVTKANLYLQTDSIVQYWFGYPRSGHEIAGSTCLLIRPVVAGRVLRQEYNKLHLEIPEVRLARRKSPIACPFFLPVRRRSARLASAGRFPSFDASWLAYLCWAQSVLYLRRFQ